MVTPLSNVTPLLNVTPIAIGIVLLSVIAASTAIATSTATATVPAAKDDPAGKNEPAEKNDPRRRSGLELFEKRIRPALIRHCYECHSADSDDLGGELRLDTKAGWQSGGTFGAAIEPGDPDASLLIRAIEYEDVEMPPDQPLPGDVIADFRKWVSLGAPDPRTETVAPNDTSDNPDSSNNLNPADTATKRWSLKPVAAVDAARDVDRYVADRLHQEGLQPNGPADPATLIRRLHFDLVGLPPSPEVIAEFESDPSDTRYAAMVDRLLASPQFGERWGRHWLDVARYGESAGSSRDVLSIYAWRYRDYVIDAFNRDVPFDRFVTEQVAGDLLPAETEAERKRLQVATGLLAIGSKSLNGGNLVYDVIDDQIDVVSRSVLGLTVSCARCHDHKFDPIPTADYYSLAGIFLSTDTRYGGSINRPKSAADRLNVYLPLGSPPDADTLKQTRQLAKEIETLQQEQAKQRKRVETLRKKVAKPYRDEAKTVAAAAEPPDDLKPAAVKQVRQYAAALEADAEATRKLQAARKRLPPEPEYGVGVTDADKPRDAKILIRGEKNQTGDLVTRGFLSAVDPPLDAPVDPSSDASATPDTKTPARVAEPIDDNESGRRQLAAWLVHPDNPLTPRVAVNRVWQHLMGSGIVETVDNFGVSGLPPSHPELLDHLAHRFVHDHHWSTKGLIRELVLTQTYRRSSTGNARAEAVDPENRLRWRMPRRRLEAEPLRDAMLAVSGMLRADPPEGSLVLEIGEGEVGRNLNTKPLDKPFDHRSVYLPIIRGIIPEPLDLFDFPEPSNVQGLRDSNTTPTQALYFMNSDSVVRIAEQFATRLLNDPALDNDADRVRHAHRLCFGQSPTDDAIARATEFLKRLRNATDEAPASDAEKDAASADPNTIAWASYCQTLLASAPFRYLD